MTQIKLEVIVRFVIIIIVVLFTVIEAKHGNSFIESKEVSNDDGNNDNTKTFIKETISTVENSHDDDDIIINQNKLYFSYLNDTRTDEELINYYLNDTNLEPIGAKRLHLAPTNASTLADNPFPPTRSPKNRLRVAGGYEAMEVAQKTPEEIIRLRGFKFETHYAHTKDGYHIHVVRIINPKLSPPSKRPVIFNHGLFESSTIWLMNSRNIKPSTYKQVNGKLPQVTELDAKTAQTNGPFLLANTGYDVWLMSMRGTEFSLKHDIYNHSRDSKFWRYSLDHFALIDIPTVVDYVIAKTKVPSIGYVGHSQATYTIFALLATKPQYTKLLKPVVAVAPVSHFKHMTSVSRLLMRGVDIFTALEQNGPFPRNGYVWRKANHHLCATKLLTALPCQFANTLISGAGQHWPTGYYSHVPFQTSLMVLRHFGQMISSGRFSRYDYGYKKNDKFYRRVDAPDHPMEKIKNKWIALIGGDADLLSTPKDMRVIEKSLRVKLKRNILIKGFNHFDLITSDRVGKEVFEPILEILERAEAHDKQNNNNNTSSNNISNNHQQQQQLEQLKI